MVTLQMKCLLLIVFIGGIEAGLRDRAKKIYIGTAATVSELADTIENVLAGEEFNMLTPGNEMKWDATESNQGKKIYTNADSIVRYAQKNKMRIRGHCLVWHEQLPAWVKSLDKTQLNAAMESRIKDIVGHYKGKLYGWDVINEIFDWNGNLRSSIWTQQLGETFVAEAFRMAHEADPSAKLYINDYGTEAINSKSTGMYNFVKKLKSQGVPVHGVGFQTHIQVGGVPSTFESNLRRFTELGVEVAITELDVSINLPSNSATLEQQAKDYAAIVNACQAVNGCVGIIIWGFTDKHSWIPSVSPGHGDALIFDADYKPKPAYKSIFAALK